MSEQFEWMTIEEDEEIVWTGKPTWASVVPQLITILGIIPAYWRVSHTEFVITNRNIYKKTGGLSTNVDKIAIENVQDTSYSQSFVGNMFGFGSVDISTAGGSGAEVSFKGIENPQEIQEIINKYTPESPTTGLGQSSAPAQPTSGNISEEQLDELLEELKGTQKAMRKIEEILSK